MNVESRTKHVVEHLLEHLKKLPKTDHTDNAGVTGDEQALLNVLGTVALLFGGEAAEKVEIGLGLLSQLRNLPQGKSLILTLSCEGDPVQVELKRLEKLTEPLEFMSCIWCVNKHPPPMLRCCGAISRP